MMVELQHLALSSILTHQRDIARYTLGVMVALYHSLLLPPSELPRCLVAARARGCRIGAAALAKCAVPTMATFEIFLLLEDDDLRDTFIGFAVIAGRCRYRALRRQVIYFRCLDHRRPY